jgi:predicted DNA-binding transcriptional regulator
VTYEEKIYRKVLEFNFITNTLVVPVINKMVAVRVANLLRRDGFKVEVSSSGYYDFMYISINPPQAIPPA